MLFWPVFTPWRAIKTLAAEPALDGLILNFFGAKRTFFHRRFPILIAMIRTDPTDRPADGTHKDTVCRKPP